VSPAVLALGAALAAPGSVLVLAPAGPDRGAPGWIGAAVEETLPRALGRAGVVAPSAADQRRALAVLGLGGPVVTRASAVRAAESLGARHVVFGDWELAGGELLLRARPLDVATARLEAPLLARGPLSELGRLVQELANELAGRERALPAAAPTFDALRALGEALAARDASTRLAGLRRALTLQPGYPTATLALARQLHDTGRLEEARAALAAMARDAGLERERRFLDAACLLGLGRFAEADVAFAALLAERTTAPALANRAAARLRLPGGPSGASALMRQALERAPFATELPLGLGYSLLVEGEAEAAVFWLRDTVRYAPSDARARLALSWALRGTEDAEEADEQWRAAASLDASLEPRRQPDLTARLERVLASEAGLLLDTARAADTRKARELAARGEALLAAGRADEGILALQEAVRLEARAAGPHIALARAYRARGDRSRALEELRLALLCREDPSLRLEIAELAREL